MFAFRGDCSFCWYWWNCWPLLFKISFHNPPTNVNTNVDNLVHAARFCNNLHQVRLLSKDWKAKYGKKKKTLGASKQRNINRKANIGYCYRCLFICLFSLGHCVICPSIYGFWLPRWYLQTRLSYALGRLTLFLFCM